MSVKKWIGLHHHRDGRTFLVDPIYVHALSPVTIRETTTCDGKLAFIVGDAPHELFEGRPVETHERAELVIGGTRFIVRESVEEVLALIDDGMRAAIGETLALTAAFAAEMR